MGNKAKNKSYVWTNFTTGILFNCSLWVSETKKVTLNILSLSALILIMAFVGLFIHINSGGLYETKTIGAMIFIIIVTLAFVLIAYLKFIKNEKNN